jgi:hypothetical protein
MNDQLLSIFTEEIERALAQMGLLKSPGLDGFAACFYQKSWATVKKEVCKAILDFLNDGVFNPSINKTFIALIPIKKKKLKVWLILGL